MKIAQDTYKIFFVDNTEDYFYRRIFYQNKESKEKFTRQGRTARSNKWRLWLNSDEGWKKNLSEDPEKFCEEFESWMLYGGSSKDEKQTVVNVENEGIAFRKFFQPHQQQTPPCIEQNSLSIKLIESSDPMIE